jgi:predicted O-methyltransferase YrrM
MIKCVGQWALDVRPIDWLGHREYLQAGEMEILVALVRSVDAQTMIEIGCRDGRTARMLLRNVPSLDRYIGIDVPFDYQPTLAHQKNEMVAEPGHLAMIDERFELIIREHGSLGLKPSELPRVDVVFIDGDHSVDAVEHDSKLARAIVNPGGLILWHDFNDSPHVQVTRVLNRLADEGWPIQHVEGTWLAFMRI